MSKSIYKVSLVKQGLKSQWLDYRTTSASSETLETAKDGSLGQTVMIIASTIEEAIALAKTQNFGYTIITDDTHRIGKA